MSSKTATFNPSRTRLVHQQKFEQVQDLTAVKEYKDRQRELLWRRCQTFEDKFKDMKKKKKKKKKKEEKKKHQIKQHHANRQSTKTNLSVFQRTNTNPSVFNHRSAHSHNNKQWPIHHHYPLHSADTNFKFCTMPPRLADDTIPHTTGKGIV